MENVSADLYEKKTAQRQFTSVQGLNEDFVGEVVFKSGARTGVNHGEIVTTDGTYNFGYSIFFHMRESKNPDNHGDSGAPVYVRHGSSGAEVAGVLKGFIKYQYSDGSTNVNCIYSHVQYVLNDLGLDGIILKSDIE